MHIATPAEIGGAIDANEIRVFHIRGPAQGMFLAQRLDDPTLLPAIQGGDVLPESAGPWVIPPSFPVGSGLVEITILGRGFNDRTDVNAVGASVSGVTVTPTTVVFDIDLTGKPAGPITLQMTSPASTLTVRVV